MKICVMAGDGIGPEIVEQAVQVLKAPALGLHASFSEALVGGAAYRAEGYPLPSSSLESARAADAILFGAVGDFSLDTLPRELRRTSAPTRAWPDASLCVSRRCLAVAIQRA